MKKPANYPRRERKGRVQLYVSGGWRYAQECECWYCGTKFLTRVTGHNKGRYCTPECVSKAQKKKFDKQRPELTCVICSTKFKVKPHEIDRHKTCGRTYCRSAIRKRVAEKRWKEGSLGPRSFQEAVRLFNSSEI